MTGPFVLEIFAPDKRFFTPQGGSTLIPLTGDWLKPDGVTRYGCAFTVSDTETFDFGGQSPALTVTKSMAQFGDKIQGYARKDRNFKCTVYALGDTLGLAQFGVQALQAALIEATQYSASSYMNDGYGDAKGTLLFLKYQADSTSKVLYFRIVSGFVDVSSANAQVAMNANIMKVTLNIRIPYTGFSNAVWLQNKVPNGSCAYALSGYTFSGVSAPAYDSVLASVAGPGKSHWWVEIPGGILNGRFNRGATGVLNGMEQMWGIPNTSSDVCTGFAYTAGNQAGTDIIFTPEASIKDGGSGNGLINTIWLAFEYFDNAAASAYCSAQLQVWNYFSGGAWSNVGSAIVPTNNVAIQRYAWNTSLQLGTVNGVQSYTSKFRVAFSFDRSRSFSTQAVVKKIALWTFPATLPAAMVALPTEYVSQAQNSKQATFITNIQGNAEAPVKVKVANPLQPIAMSTANTVVYQQLYLGARKHTKYPYRHYYSYQTSPAANIGVGVTYGNTSYLTDQVSNNDLATLNIQTEDMNARQYRVLERYASNAAFMNGFSMTSANLPGEYQIVPNGSIVEIPSSASATVTTDAGTATLPPFNGSHTYDIDTTGLGYNLRTTRKPNWWAGRSASSGAGAITLNLFEIWFLPTDQYIVVDTRLQDLAGTDADTNAWSNLGNDASAANNDKYCLTRELVIDSLFRIAPTVYMGNNGEFDTGSSTNAPAYAGTGFSFWPTTPTSPEPMQFSAVVRRQGTAGVPSTDVNSTDPIELTFLYFPSWES